MRYWLKQSASQRRKIAPEWYAAASEKLEEALNEFAFRDRLTIRAAFLKRRILDATYVPIRDYFYRRAADCLVGELAVLARKLNRPDFHVFVSLAGHVDSISVRVFPKGWESESVDEIKILEGPLPGYRRFSKMTPRDMRNAMRRMIHLSELNDLRR